MTPNVSVVSQISPAIFGLDREYLIKGFNDDKVLKAYYEYMVDTAVMLGADRNRAETELWESLQFEISLAHVSSIFHRKKEEM